jgi:hypothetical protein
MGMMMMMMMWGVAISSTLLLSWADYYLKGTRQEASKRDTT